MRKSSTEEIHQADTRFGFEYGDACVERSWDRRGYASIMVLSITTGRFVEVVVSPKGRSIRVDHGRLK